MSGIQNKITTRVKKQENTTYDKEKKSLKLTLQLGDQLS